MSDNDNEDPVVMIMYFCTCLDKPNCHTCRDIGCRVCNVCHPDKSEIRKSEVPKDWLEEN